MEKIKVSHVCGVAIIYRQSDPSQIFLEVKDDGYPPKIFRRCLCLIGGNWIGDLATRDCNPLETAKREFLEEISLDSSAASTLESQLLGYIPEGEFYRTPRSSRTPKSEERQALAELKGAILERYISFGDFITHVPKEVFLRADPEYKKEGVSVLISCYAAGLDERLWKELMGFQNSFFNLSNESVTVVVSLNEIIFGSKIKTIFGQDRILQKFFLTKGFSEAEKFPLIKGISCRRVKGPFATYEKYFDHYEVLRHP